MPAQRSERLIRIGYARTPTARQERASQLDALREADCHKIYQEQLSTRIKMRPELERALALARQFKEAASDSRSSLPSTCPSAWLATPPS